jgi:hypothetical protein
MERLSLFRKIISLFVKICIVLFALIGFVFTGVFVAMQFDLLNVRGSIADRNDFFIQTYENVTGQNTEGMSSSTMQSATGTAPSAPEILENLCLDTRNKVCEWKLTPEWEVIKSGLLKDRVSIEKVSKETGVSSRMIVSVVVPEQVRFFTSNREVFKRWFEPMKILGTLTKFSLGVSGIKLETAEEIERHLKDTTSSFYPEYSMAPLIAYQNEEKNNSEELFNRLTNEDDHYYSYLYTALYIKEITAQWQKAGYDISGNPDALVTLFNIGFQKSVPSASPVAGGAEITVGGTTYTYGELGSLVYFSDELTDVYPRE